MKRYSSGRVSRGDHLINAVMYMLILISVLLCTYPVWFALVASFSDPTYVNTGELLLWPKGTHLTGYKMVLEDWRILTGYKNTLLYTVFGTMLGLIVSLAAGYSLSRKDLPGRRILMLLMVFTMFFHGGMIPTYLTVKNLGLINTRTVLIVIGSVSVYNIILIRTFFMSSIPSEMMEAAFIDGCSNTRFFFQFVLPLSKAIIAVIGLYLAVGYWNNYFNALLYVTDRTMHPLQLFLRDILISAQSTDIVDGDLASEFKKNVQIVKYAVIVISTVPVMCLYPFLQKYFVQGVMLGSVKG